MDRRDFLAHGSTVALLGAGAVALPAIARANAAPDPTREPVSRPLTPPPPAGPLHLRVGDVLAKRVRTVTCDGEVMKLSVEAQESSAPGRRDGWVFSLVLDPADVAPGRMVRRPTPYEVWNDATGRMDTGVDDDRLLRLTTGDVRITLE